MTRTPDRLTALTPYLACDGAVAAMAWYARHFGAVESFPPIVMEDGRLGHAEIAIAGAAMMISDPFPEIGVVAPAPGAGSSASYVVYVDDVDATFAAAVADGAQEQMPVEDQFHGSRSGWLVDPWGHRWNVSTFVEEVPHEESLRRMEAQFTEE